MDDDPSSDATLDAGAFAHWVGDLSESLAGTRDSDVPCGSCTACCTSSQFIHIGPDETDALRHIPEELRFPAPGLPKGHVLLGYDERGHCPMLVDGACSIYEHRPRTCRTYDCRVFPAAGTEPEGADKEAIAVRVRRWRFSYPTPDDVTIAAAVRAAAAFIEDRAEAWPPGSLPSTTTRCAVLAVEVHRLFLQQEPGGTAVLIEPDEQAVRTLIEHLAG